MTITMTPKLKRKIKKIWKAGNDDRIDRLECRQDQARRIALMAEGGKIAAVSRGRDCDGVRWENAVTLLPASCLAVERWESHEDEWADGPWGYRLERPSEAAKLRRSSRDLTLEAFEDGHSHVIYA